MAHIQVLTSLIASEALLPLVAKEYRLDEPIHCRLACTNDNDHYLITAGDTKYMLRVYTHAKHWLDNESDYLFELDWLAFLHEEGLPIAYPILNNSGGYLGALSAPEGRRYWALFSYAPGNLGLDEAQSVIFGRSIAQIHLASNRFRSTHSRAHFDLERLADKPLRQIRSWLGDQRPADVEFLTALAEKLKQQVEAAEFTGDEYGIIGGDFHGNNHHFTEANQITHFDFDLCGYGWRAYDLAIFRWAAGSKEAIWQGFLQGYEALRPLSERERTLIPIFTQLRHIWWMGSHTTYPSSPSWLNEGNWDRKFTRLRELDQQCRDSAENN